MGTAQSAEGVIVESQTKRRHRTKRERRQVVEETLQPGASVAVVARRHGVNANQVFHWRKLYREGKLDGGDYSSLQGLVRVNDDKRNLDQVNWPSGVTLKPASRGRGALA